MLYQYTTIKTASETETVINKSRFIAKCLPIDDEPDALAKIAAIRATHAGATHNCYAYRLGARGDIARFSDDGEPGGTAGLPMMEALNKSGVTNALCVVTRYFGGILLGAGGLVRAYSSSAAAAIRAAQKVILVPAARIEFAIDYSRYGGIEGYVRENADEVSIEFLENVRFSVMVNASRADAFMAAIVERTDARAEPVIVGEGYVMLIPY